MPVKISSKLPAFRHLEQENIFVMSEQRAVMQDIRPLKIAILNLMPNKETTETQLLRLISNSPLQVEIVFLKTASYEAKNTSQEHLTNFYRTFDEVRKEKFDGLIITGAPVEKLDFEEVLYWPELKSIMSWAKTNVYSTFYICWAAQAGLYYHYGIKKYQMDKKISGIYNHKVLNKKNPLTFGFDDFFAAPHSRYTEVRRADIEKIPEIEILAESPDAGVYLCAGRDLRNVFVTGHGEYDADTLHKEYMRDLEKGIEIHMPDNYYLTGDINRLPDISWRSHASLLFMNWLNYSVYQNTPYDINLVDA